jgi:O-6-methylguanine DNA methyltransferase
MKRTIATDAGKFTAHYSKRGLAQLDFPGDERRCRGEKTNGETASGEVQRWHELTTTALRDTLAGKAPAVFPPMDLSIGTDFQREVWGVMQKIATGRTMSYGEIAVTLRKPGSARAVGAACGANPIPVLVPCHRVLAANSRLGGFSSGLDWKRKLLAREGII